MPLQLSNTGALATKDQLVIGKGKPLPKVSGEMKAPKANTKA